MFARDRAWSGDGGKHSLVKNGREMTVGRRVEGEGKVSKEEEEGKDRLVV